MMTVDVDERLLTNRQLNEYAKSIADAMKWISTTAADTETADAGPQ